jgi:uncharacterized protein YbbK (DUF523 family)
LEVHHMASAVSAHDKPKIAISACLLGAEVRFNGGHKESRLCSQALSEHFDFVPLCPEVAIGLGIPRQPIRLIGNPQQPLAVGSVDSALDVTGPLHDYGVDMAAEHTDICGYIFMQKSPSCGSRSIRTVAARPNSVAAAYTPAPSVTRTPTCRWKKTVA